MKNWEDDDDSEYCSSNVDFVDAAAVADVIGIEIEHVKPPNTRTGCLPSFCANTRRAHAQPRCAVQRRDQVQGLSWTTPMAWGERIATGHYARVRQNPAAGLF